MIDIKTIIRNSRIKKGYTMKELGEKVGVSEATISRWESGEIANMKYNAIVSLSQALDVDPMILMGIPHDDNKDSVPLVGTIAAGTPILASENIEEYFKIDNSVKADFCLRVKGDSMIDEGIFSDDIVFIKQQPVVENGEIGAVVIDGEATLKRVYVKSDSLVLQPANSNYEPIIVTDGEVLIAGKLVAVLNLRT